MIELYTFPQAFGLFSSSPFCVKAAYLLNMSGQAWHRHDTLDPRQMPHGKLPVIKAGEDMIADSDNIQSYLETRGADFNKGLSDLDRATARAYIRMAEEHFYFHLLLDRWGDDRQWPAIRDTFFAGMPAGLRHLVAGGVRKNMLRGLYQQGLGRLTAAQRMDRIAPDLDAITTRLRQGTFLFGDAPTAADTSVAPMLAAAAVSPEDTLLKTTVRDNKVLTDYVARVEAACG